eukprot:gnl/MRDRNA2_/MRDRNA2_30757_c0_seq1.p1 gnl/MRDRNA2_/MRDRNA2_30757_c0~~gnl/MRDRNA2_/MRDRNA2_30757_c0_seq1.p1  ORF type:complete len:669 (-),score=151.36 gnl/MRDRNA2_/MRDRNA2_30757_c0_seq1:85-2091(-)
MPKVKIDQRVDELEEQVQNLTSKQGSDISSVKEEIKKAVAEQRAAIEPSIADAGGKGEKAAADAESRVTVALGELRTDMGSRIESIEEQLRNGLRSLETKLEKMIKDGDQAVTTTTIALGERLVADAERRVGECREELLRNLEEVKMTVQTSSSDSSAVEKALSEALEQSSKAAQAELEARSTQHEIAMKDISKRLDQNASDISQALDKAKSTLNYRLEEVNTQLTSQMTQSMEKLESQTLSQLTTISSDVGNQITDIRNTVKGAQNTHTRAVTWKITNFRTKLQQMLGSDGQSIWSPDFSLCATPMMALQLQVSAPADVTPTPVPLKAPHLQNKVLPLPGMCSLYLWGEPGMKVIFRIALGESGHGSKRYEHSFEAKIEEEGSKRVPFFMPNLSTLDRVWDEKLNQLTVVFELLELKYIVHRQEVVAPPEASLPTASPQDQPANLGSTEMLILSRQVAADALMTDRVNREIQVVKNRSVRRVEWLLDGCIGLLQFSQVGESVDSAVFSAAGLEKIQLHFYPRGLNSDSQGNCSCFISCGRHTYLRCQLSVGKQSRAIEHHFERNGEVYGKSRFGTMDSQLAGGDTLLIAMDIHEAHAPLVDKGMLRGPGDARGANTVTSVLRLKKADQTEVDEVLRCASLPSLGLGGGASKKMPRIQSNPQMAKSFG